MTFMVVRVDGRGFTKFCQSMQMEKPNDLRGIQLMNKAATEVVHNFKDIVIAYGDSDEYSFVFKRRANLFNRRKDKITSCVVSLFSASYVFYLPQFFKDQVPTVIPSFDARMVLYPTMESLKDYLSWRQVDCHINNLYNTTFWALVQQDAQTPQEAHKILKGTLSKDKHEILFTKFKINYNDVAEVYKKGTIIMRLESITEVSENLVDCQCFYDKYKLDDYLISK